MDNDKKLKQAEQILEQVRILRKLQISFFASRSKSLSLLAKCKDQEKIVDAQLASYGQEQKSIFDKS